MVHFHSLQPVAESTRFSFGSNDPLSSHHHSARQTRFHASYAVDLVVARIVFTRGRDQTDLPKTSCCPVIRSFGINVFLSPSPCLLPLFFLSLSPTSTSFRFFCFYAEEKRFDSSLTRTLEGNKIEDWRYFSRVFFFSFRSIISYPFGIHHVSSIVFH